MVRMVFDGVNFNLPFVFQKKVESHSFFHPLRNLIWRKSYSDFFRAFQFFAISRICAKLALQGVPDSKMKGRNVNGCKNAAKSRFGKKIFLLYICTKVKGGLWYPPFFTSFLLKTSFEEDFFSFKVGSFSFEVRNFSFEEGKNCSKLGNFIHNI
jgi:hypothetical protein